MTATAKKNGAVAVVVHLAPVSLAQLSADASGVKAAMSDRVARMIAELGSAARSGGRWDNGLGQLGISVTEAGLKILQTSGNAVSFYPDRAWLERTALSNADGRLQAIEATLARQGYVDVQVTLNVDGLEFDTAQDGSLSYRSGPKSADSASRVARELLGGISNEEALGKSSAASRFEALTGQSGAEVNPEFTVRVTREGLEKLASSKEVRALRPVGFVDKRQVNLDPAAFSRAKANGTAEVIITIRDPLAGGSMSKASFEAATRSNKRTLDAVLSAAGVKSPMKDLSVFGAVAGHLTASELSALRASGDARLLSIELNKPVARPTLATSTATAGFTNAWAAGYRGAGQNIVVMDTGVQANHRFFQGANGLSKVVYEACFGTTQSIPVVWGGPLVNFESICPQPIPGTFDSPLGLVGSAAPRLNCVPNSSPFVGACHHGTHVAGIAAGRSSPTFPAGFQGAANEANIVAVQVFSFDAARIEPPTVFGADLIAGMQAVVSAMTVGSTNNPFTVNMSFGGYASFGSGCGSPSPAVTTAVQQLFNMGVPVVVATGNANNRTNISFPACVPQTVKVGSTVNDTVGTAVSTFTNLANPGNFGGDFFWMAPGGGSGTNITSSSNSAITVNGWAQATLPLSGTSMATPHVAGLYALVKAALPGIGVNDISNWIQANASQPLAPISIGAVPGVSAAQNVTFRRILIPQF